LAVLSPSSEENTITPDSDAMEALARMNRAGESGLMVVENGRLLGIVSLRDLMRVVALRMELEGGQTAA
jgi:CBS domain-containing protein